MKIWILAAMYFVSGAAALAYEVAWNRMFASTLGASSYTLAVVLAAFMAGLAIGSRVFGRRADLSRNPLKLYGWLELGVSCWAMILPTLITLIQAAQRFVYPYFADHPVLLSGSRLIMAFAVLVVPAALMGGTYPVLGRASEGAGPLGWRAAILYSANTIGAMAGAAWAGFDGIARVGVHGTADVAAMGSLSVGLIALSLARRLEPEAAPSRSYELDPASSRTARRALVVVFVSGFSMLALEVVWTRLMIAVVATTTYAFSAILVVYLGSVAIGSAASAPILRRIRDPFRLLGWLCAGVGLSSLVSVSVIRTLTTPVGFVGEAAGAIGWFHYVAGLSWDVFRLVFPSCFLSGAMIPVAAEVLSRASVPSGHALARVYLWNTLGAMGGAPLAAFVLIPQIGRFAWVIAVIGLLLAFTALVCRTDILTLSAVVSIATIAGVSQLSIPGAVRHHLFEGKGALRYYREGATCTVAVVDYPDYRGSVLYVDSFEMAGAGSGYSYMRVLGHLPALLVPAARTGAVIGFGTGTSAAAMARHPLDAMDIIEISRDVTNASSQLQMVNRGILQRPPARPRIRVIYDDAKAWLDATTSRYDIIISEPPLPCMAGTANLFSREFYQGVRRCLKPGGTYVQWLPIHGMANTDVPGAVRSFQDVFPQAMACIYRGETVFLVAGPGSLDPSSISRECGRPGVYEELRAAGFSRAEDVIGSFLLSSEALASYAADSMAVTDDRPWVEFFSPDRRRRASPIGTLAEMLSRASIGIIPVSGPDREQWERCRHSNLLTIRALSRSVRAVDLADAVSRRSLEEESLQETQEALRLDPGNRLAQDFITQRMYTGAPDESVQGPPTKRR